ncbi:MAG: DUF3108 domain-containing protein [Prevotella sp.]|nr:DUF3108 domain-containing protein [Prevotella sp.]
MISYNMYFNWQFVWVKVGTASMSTTSTTYQGASAFRTSLITRGNGKADKFFVLRDTLTGYCTQTLSPLHYRKGAQEGSYYTVDEASYSYPDGKCRVKLHRQKNDGTHVRDTKTLNHCVYDMVNLFQRARSFDLAGLAKGHEIKFEVTDGVKIIDALLRYRGKETVKGDNGKKYSCLRLEYIQIVKGKEKQIACFYVTDDAHHIPVRIDLSLRFGSAKAYLTNMQVTGN